MTQLSSFNILIIDYPGACDLRARLIRSGATVHVVSAAASIVLARQNASMLSLLGLAWTQARFGFASISGTWVSARS